MTMGKHWIFYASIVTGITFVFLYVAISSDMVNVNVQLSAGVAENSNLGYGQVMNTLSQQINGNRSFEDIVGWMLRSELEPEEKISLQGYALGWDFYEQQTCAARNLIGLQRWATSLDFAVVEPFVHQSAFKMSQFNYHDALRLSDYFDIDVWNHKVVTTIPNGTPLVKWEDFIENAARQLIVVHTMMRSSKGTKVYLDDEMNKEGCSSAKGYTISTFKKFGFKVVRQVCFKFSAASPISIYEYNKNILGPFKANNVSIIFTFFPGVFRARINILEEKYHHKFVDWLKPSKRVINDAKRYINMFLDKSYVAVALRTVKMAVSLRPHHQDDLKEATKSFVNQCIDKVNQTLSGITGQHFMTIDLGRFGDPSARSSMTSDTRKEIIEKLIDVTYHNSWNQIEWENTFIKATNGISDKGYIASLQKEIVSHASVLIIAGGGSFQNSMLLQYKSQTTQKYSIIKPCPM